MVKKQYNIRKFRAFQPEYLQTQPKNLCIFLIKTTIVKGKEQNKKLARSAETNKE